MAEFIVATVISNTSTWPEVRLSAEYKFTIEIEKQMGILKTNMEQKTSPTELWFLLKTIDSLGWERDSIVGNVMIFKRQ